MFISRGRATLRITEAYAIPRSPTPELSAYDRIQDEYNGQYDEQHDHWVNSRRNFFTSEDIIALAKEFGALS